MSYDIGRTPKVPDEYDMSAISDAVTWDSYWEATGQLLTMPDEVAEYMLASPGTAGDNWLYELGHTIYMGAVEPHAIVASSIADIVADTVGTAVGSVAVGVGSLAAGTVSVVSYTLGAALWLAGGGAAIAGAIIPPAKPLTELMYAISMEGADASFDLGEASLDASADLAILSGQMWHNWAEETGEEVSNIQKATDLQTMVLLMSAQGRSYDEIVEYREQVMIEHDLHYEILPELSTLITAATAGYGGATGGAAKAAGTQTTATAASLSVIGGIWDAALMEDEQAQQEALLAIDASQIDAQTWMNLEALAPAMTLGEEEMIAAADQLTAGEMAALERKKGEDARQQVVNILSESVDTDDEWDISPGLVLYDQSNPGGLLIGWDGQIGDGYGEVWSTLGYSYEDLVRMLEDGTVQIVQPGDRGDTWSYYEFAAPSSESVAKPEMSQSMADNVQFSQDNPYNGLSWEVLTSGWDGHSATPFRENVVGETIAWGDVTYTLESVGEDGYPDVWYVGSNIDGSMTGYKRSDREENTGLAWEIVGDDPGPVAPSEDSGDDSV